MKNSRFSLKLFYLTAAILIGLLSLFLSTSNFKPKPTINYSLEGRSYSLLTAKTPSERESGLSGLRVDLNEAVIEKVGAEGMIFYFSPEQRVSFWNKDTYLDLTLYWLNNGQLISTTSLPSIDSGLIVVDSPGLVDEVVEIIKPTRFITQERAEELIHEVLEEVSSSSPRSHEET